MVIVAGCGILLICSNFHKNWRRDVPVAACLLAAVLIFGLWGKTSSRYSAILLYPGIFLCAYFICYVPERFPFLQDAPLMKKRISVILFALFMVLLAGKDLRAIGAVNYCRDTIKIIRKDAAGDGSCSVYVPERDCDRFSYYLRQETFSLPGSTEQGISTPLLGDFVYALRNSPGIYHFILNESSEKPVLRAADLQCTPGEWVFLGSVFRNRKQKIRFSVYRLSLPSAALKKFTPQEKERFIQQNAKYRLPNGDFEEAGTPGEHDWALETYGKRGITSFQSPDIRLPHRWSLNGVGGFAPDSMALVTMTEKKSISGHYSLRLSALSPISILAAVRYPKGNYTIRFLCRGRKASVLKVMLFLYSPRNAPLGSITLWTLPIPAGEERMYALPVPSELIPCGDQFLPAFSLMHGDLLIDEVSLAPVTDGGSSREQFISADRKEQGTVHKQE